MQQKVAEDQAALLSVSREILSALHKQNDLMTFLVNRLAYQQAAPTNVQC